MGDSSYSFQFNKMARPAGLEPAAFCLEGTQYKTLSAASGVTYQRHAPFISLLNLDRRWTENVGVNPDPTTARANTSSGRCHRRGVIPCGA
jgi:hypothetical protein